MCHCASILPANVSPLLESIPLPVYQDLVRKCLLPTCASAPSLCFPRTSAFRAADQKKSVHEDGGNGVRNEKCLVADAPRVPNFAVAHAEKCKGCPQTCSKTEPPIPLLPRAAIALSLPGNHQIYTYPALAEVVSPSFLHRCCWNSLRRGLPEACAARMCAHKILRDGWERREYSADGIDTNSLQRCGGLLRVFEHGMPAGVHRLCAEPPSGVPPDDSHISSQRG